MKIYSKLQINLFSVLVSIIIYFFLVIYIPKVLKTISHYIYYKQQPNLIVEYEEDIN